MATSFRASRTDMVQGGVPLDYVDALLDDRYMEDLIAQTSKRAKKRAKNLQSHFLLQKIVFGFLCAQALLGVWVALFKTFLQPDKIYGANTSLQNVDLVLMLDASRHMNQALGVQHSAVVQFTGELVKAMSAHAENLKQNEIQRIQQLQHQDSSNLFKWLPDWFSARPPRGLVSVQGGQLRVATGLFNANRATLLHNLTYDLTEQVKALSLAQEGSYQSTAQWISAMQLCKDVLDSSPETGHKRFCAIIGDDSAMCSKVESGEVSKSCKQWKGFCPPEADMTNLGNSFVEYPWEVEKCTDFSTQHLAPDPTNARLILMFTVASKEEAQVRLRNPAFQRFVRATTDCVIRRETTVVNRDGVTSVIAEFFPGEKCTRFIMGNGFDDLVQKSRNISRLLKDEANDFNRTNPFKDTRYKWFLLLPLNLVLFVIWSQILRCTKTVKTQADRAMGKKKKVIKVTKFLVEKPVNDPMVQKAREQLTEVELAEMSSLRPAVQFGAPMTLRARLKGAYLRTSADGYADGNGHAFDPNSNWTLEPINEDGQLAGCLEPGQRFRIRNAKEELLRADAGGLSFASSREAARRRARDEAMEFELAEAEPGVAKHLGETLQIRACGTKQLLRVKKDGRCDALGGAAEHETQLVIDRGGPLLNAGSVVTLRSAVTDSFLHGTCEGGVSALPGGQDWRFWKIEKAGEAKGSAAAVGSPSHMHLKQGDVVTLQSFNQQMLRACRDGKVHTGSDGAGADSAVGGTEQFVIERVDMSMTTSRDHALRTGMQVCLKPHWPGAAESNDEPGASPACMKVNDDGSVSADGKVTQREITFTVEFSKLHEMVEPLQSTLQQGDVQITFSPLWNKNETKTMRAVSAGWTQDEDLKGFKGPLVVASEKGTYLAPHARGGDSGWVAVVNEGVDVPKAARQARLQGASGLIVRCEEVLSLQRLGRTNGAGADPPELPALFVDQAVGEALDERGLLMTGATLDKLYVSDALRALGSSDHSCEKAFGVLGSGMQELTRERAAARAAQREAAANAPAVAVEEEATSYNWKVKSNTHYLWGKSGGGATKMNVNFGKVAPPSAVTRNVESADAQAGKRFSFLGGSRVTKAGIAVVEAEDFKHHRLAEELSEVVTMDNVPEEPMEQLDEESDFKIEYKFEEMQVAEGEKPEELEEQEIIEEQEAVVAKLGVPRKQFRIVFVGMVISTTLLICILHNALNAEYRPLNNGAAGQETLTWM